MIRSLHCCVWLFNTDTMDYRDLSCDHYMVVGKTCTSYLVNSVLGSYRYIRIIIFFNIICHVLIPGTSSHLLVFLQSSLYVCHSRIHNLSGLCICALKTLVPDVIAARTAVMSSQKGSTCDLFSAHSSTNPVLSKEAF